MTITHTKKGFGTQEEVLGLFVPKACAMCMAEMVEGSIDPDILVTMMERYKSKFNIPEFLSSLGTIIENDNVLLLTPDVCNGLKDSMNIMALIAFEDRGAKIEQWFMARSKERKAELFNNWLHMHFRGNDGKVEGFLRLVASLENKAKENLSV